MSLLMIIMMVQCDDMVGNTRRQQISSNDLVISLVPAFLHADIARHCIELRKNMVTASYVSPGRSIWRCSVNKT